MSHPLTCAVLLVVALAGGVERAAGQGGATVTVEETAGIRRTNFPARAMIEVAEGRLADPTRVGLLDGNTDLPVQGTAVSRWPDGSVRGLELDFNLSVAPLETRTLALRYGSDIDPLEVARGLTVEAGADGADGIQVGRIRLGETGAPLVRSVAYRNELIVAGGNGLFVTDDRGVRHAPSEVSWLPPQIVKRGPLVVQVRHRGRLDLGGGAGADVSIDLEMPSSKSWLRLTADVTDPDRRVRAIAFELPVSLGEYPWTWDFGTPNGTYGAFRDPAGSAILTQTIGEDLTGAWTVRAGAKGEERPLEQSAPGRSEVVRGWAHLQSGQEAVAFALEGLGAAPGTFQVTLDGGGQSVFGFEPGTPGARQFLSVYAHFVSVPVPIGAATSPSSILSPMRVDVVAAP